MRVLLCGGSKTNNIIDIIKPRFKQGGVDFVAETNITNIESLFNRGDYFDRAILLEQCWTFNGKSTDELEIRGTLSDFIASVSTKTARDTTFIFVATSEEMAKIVSEETIEIAAQCVVLLQTHTYTAKFFTKTIVTPIDSFPESWLFDISKMKSNTVEEEESIIYSSEHSHDSSDSGKLLEPVKELDFDITKVVDNSKKESEAESEPVKLDVDTIHDFDEAFEDDFETSQSMTDFDNLEDTFKEEQDTESNNESTSSSEEYNFNFDNSFNNELLHQEETAEEDNTIDDPSRLQKDSQIQFDDDFITIDDNFDTDDSDECIFDASLNETSENEVEPDSDDEPKDLFRLNTTDETQLEDFHFNMEDIDMNDENDFDDFETSKYTTDFDEDTIDDTTDFEDNFEFDDNFDDNTSELESNFDLFEDDNSESVNMGDIADQFSKDIYENSSKIPDEHSVDDEIIKPVPESKTKKEQKQGLFGLGKSKEKKTKEKSITKKKETVVKQSGRGQFKDDIDSRLISILNAYRSRGCSIVVTGTPSSGKSVITYNLANLLASLNYSVLIVDMDTVNRTQAYLSKDAYGSVHSLDAENASLKQALNAVNHGIGKYVNVVKPRLHLLTMGLAGDIVTGEKLAPKQKLARFASNVRNSYNFIIYDMPFNCATEYAADITFTADNIIITCDASNHGLMSMMLSMCNIDSEDMQEAMFGRSNICFTKYRNFNNVLGGKVNSAKDALTTLDMEVQRLLGIDPEYYFSSINTCGILPYDERYEDCWFKETQISDTEEGRAIFIQLLSNILLRG